MAFSWWAPVVRQRRLQALQQASGSTVCRRARPGC